MKPVLLAGETFFSATIVGHGADASTRAGHANGALNFIAALKKHSIDVVQIGNERCEAEFPHSPAEFDAYSAVVISDVSALTLLITSDTRLGRPGVNRLEVLRSWVEMGGGLLMAGGYLGFQGMQGAARFHGTPIEECLPVECLAAPDGIEAPEGAYPRTLVHDHVIVTSLPQPWPPLLGFNELLLRGEDEGEMIACADYRGRSYPLLTVRHYGEGRSLAWATDIGPHWLSAEFMAWSGYAPLMSNMMRWIASDI